MKKIKIFVCIAVSSLVLLGVVLGSTKWITKKAFTKVAEDVPAEPVLDEKGEILGSDDIHPLPKQMLFSTPTAQSDAITVRASITPADANIIKLNWNIAFKNAESQWAQGKNVSDYILIEANNTTCNVSCLQEFGEPIQLICSSKYNPSISASCTLNYGKRILDRTLAFEQQEYCHYDTDKKGYYISFTNDRILDFAQSSEENSTFGIGTAALNVEEIYYLKTEQSFLDFINANDYELALSGKSLPQTYKITELNMDMKDLVRKMGADPGCSEASNLLFYDLLPDYIHNHPDTPLFWIVLEIWHNDVKINSFEYSICAAEWNYGISIQSIALNPNPICM